jgi:hydroxyacylglutathione hydrolase
LNISFVEDRILFTADSIPLKNDIPNYDNYSLLMSSLHEIKKEGECSMLLTSWTPPLTDRLQMKKLIEEGEEYMLRIDKAVKEAYRGEEIEPLSFCGRAIGLLELPPFLVNPVVDGAFRSHLPAIGHHD